MPTAFTIEALARAKQSLCVGRGDSIYSPERDLVSFEVSQIQSPHDRGTVVEKMVAEMLQQCGIEAEHVGGKGQADIVIYTGGRKIVAECKSSTLGPVSRRYEFTGIKPEELDVLIMAFVTPEGIKVKTMSQQAVKAWVKIGGKGRSPAIWSDSKQGYTIGFKEDMTNPKVVAVDWDPENLRI